MIPSFILFNKLTTRMVKPTPNKITGRYGMNSPEYRWAFAVTFQHQGWNIPGQLGRCLAVSKPLYQPLTTLLLSTKKEIFRMNECRIHIHVRDAGLQFCQREIINILLSPVTNHQLSWLTPKRSANFRNAGKLSCSGSTLIEMNCTISGF